MNAVKSVPATVPQLTINPTAFAGLMQLSKALQKLSPRNYATVIGIREGLACVTDGFSLVQWQPADSRLAGIDASIKPDMTESAIKFPQWRAVVSQAQPCIVDSVRVELLVQHYKPLRAAHQVRLVISSAGIPTLAANPDVDSFNPDLLANAFKALPNDARLDRAEIRDEQLQLYFTSSAAATAGSWLVLVMMVKASNE